MTLYQLVLALHISANFIAFGILFAWPLLPARTAAAHHARRRSLSNVVSYAAIVALLAGAYLATDASAWGRRWVQIPLAIFVIVLGLVGGVLTRGEQIMEVTAPDGQRPDWGHYQASRRRVNIAAAICIVLVLAAVVTMTAKPFS
jgi:hypothetical protein